MDSILFQGTERWTLELEGTLPSSVAQAQIGPHASATPDADGLTRVSVVLFLVENLRFTAFPWFAVTYTEALWRIEAEHRGERVWVAVRCDLDSLWARLGDGLFVRYRDRGSVFHVTDDPTLFRVHLRSSEGRLTVQAGPSTDAVEQSPPRRLLIPKTSGLLQVPWEEVPAPSAHEVGVSVTLDDLSAPTLGHAVTWSPRARLLRGRVHRCGRSFPV